MDYFFHDDDVMVDVIKWSGFRDIRYASVSVLTSKSGDSQIRSQTLVGVKQLTKVSENNYSDHP